MSQYTLSIKANNHRIYQCPFSKKEALLQELIKEYPATNIIVFAGEHTESIAKKITDPYVKVLEDRALVDEKELSTEIVISYSLPQKAIVYTARASKATHKAFLLLDESEQKELHAVEMLLGRAIKQDTKAGYEYEVKEKPVTKQERQEKRTAFANKAKASKNEKYSKGKNSKREKAPKKEPRKIQIKAKKS
ncbi:MAG: hypothetical protein JXQ67_10670 [Campylobacterales bacterium]|nr:hypothetical protein [Campylobacterales bacterium]